MTSIAHSLPETGSASRGPLAPRESTTSVRELLMKQRTMLMSSLRGLMAEFGIVVAEGPRHIGELVAILVDPGHRRIPAPLHGGLVRIAEAT
jgi:hypothetical protein